MKKNLFGLGRVVLATLVSIVSITTAFAQEANPLKGQKVLVFSLTKGFRHSSIKPGQIALFKMAKEKGFSVDTTENPAVFWHSCSY